MTALNLHATTNNGLGFRDLGLGQLGGGVQSDVTGTLTGPQNILVATWITPQLAAVNLGANTVTINIWGLENNMSANSGFRVVVYRTNSAGVNQSTILTTTMASELTTSNAARNWTATATATNLSAGDRIKVEVRITDVGGTMGNGFNVTEYYASSSAGVSGDSYVSFTETISPASNTYDETVTVADSRALQASSLIQTNDSLSQATSRGVQAESNITTQEAISQAASKSVSVSGNLVIEETLYG